METWIAILSMVSTFIVGGGLSVLVTVKSIKKKSSAEATSVEVDNLTSVIKGLREQVEFANENSTKLQELRLEDAKRHAAESQALNERISNLERKMDEMHEMLVQKELENNYLESLKCERHGCIDRVPPVQADKK